MIKTLDNIREEGKILPGDLVLDNCIGSGTTAVAAINTGRQWIGIEQSQEYCEIAARRIVEAMTPPKQTCLV